MALDRPERQWLLDMYKRLIQLRRTRPELTWPWLRDIAARTVPEQGILTFWRGNLQVVCNFSDSEQEFELDVDVAWSSQHELPEMIFSTSDALTVSGTCTHIPAHTAAVFAAMTE